MKHCWVHLDCYFEQRSFMGLMVQKNVCILDWVMSIERQCCTSRDCTWIMSPTMLLLDLV